MELQDITPENLPLEKLTHLRFTEHSVQTLERLIELLNERIHIINNGDEELTIFERNERAISLVKTEMELSSTHTNIIKKRMYIKDLRTNLANVLVEMASNWQNVFDKLSAIEFKNLTVQDLLNKQDWAMYDENWELAIDVYLRAKEELNPEKSKEKKLSKVE
jgi:hypothetical protein